MALPHFGGLVLNCNPFESKGVLNPYNLNALDVNIKKSETVLINRGTITYCDVLKNTLQFFINAVEDLTLLEERACLVVNINWQSEIFKPSNFLGDIIYVSPDNGHKAPIEKSTILYKMEDLIEYVSTYDWIFIYQHNMDKEAETLFNFYDKTVFTLKEGATHINKVWWRNSDHNTTILGKHTYKHLWKGSKYIIEDDLN